MEKIIQTKSCKKCSANFDITDIDLEFYKKISPKFDGKTYEIPSPTLCPECRQQRRLSFRNERKLYKRKCDATGENIISIYSPDKAYKIYNSDFWWSDKWDVMDYGKDFNFERGFFEQFEELMKKVPKRALIKGTKSENCDYVNFVGESKNCYLIFNAKDNEKCYYSNGIINCNYVLDSTLMKNSNHCYFGIDSDDCNNCFWIQFCNNCFNSSYLYNCKNCSNCFLCINLENKEYCINNIEYSKNDYLKQIEILKNKGINSLFNEMKKKSPLKSLTIINSENCDGNIIYNSKNIKGSFEVYDSENIMHSSNIFNGVKDSSDVFVGLNSCLLYESLVINKNCSNILFSLDCWSNSNNLYYCLECKNSNNCFGCTGVIGKEYCIFNKQYTKEEYNKLVPQIIEHMKKTGEWGEFFPSSISPFGYNETVAQEYFPLKKEDTINGHLYSFNWSDYESPTPKVEKIIPANKLPEKIEDIPDDILNWAIECEVTKKPFRIIKQELEFYRKHNLPIPRKHPDQRHLERMELRNPRKLFDRKCDKCSIEMKTTYSSEREEVVYCEKCYEKEIY